MISKTLVFDNTETLKNSLATSAIYEEHLEWVFNNANTI